MDSGDTGDFGDVGGVDEGEVKVCSRQLAGCRERKGDSWQLAVSQLVLTFIGERAGTTST